MLRFDSVTSIEQIPPGTPVDIRWKDSGVRLTIGHVRRIVDSSSFELAAIDLKWIQNIDLSRWDVRALIGTPATAG